MQRRINTSPCSYRINAVGILTLLIAFHARARLIYRGRGDVASSKRNHSCDRLLQLNWRRCPLKVRFKQNKALISIDLHLDMLLLHACVDRVVIDACVVCCIETENSVSRAQPHLRIQAAFINFLYYKPASWIRCEGDLP